MKLIAGMFLAALALFAYQLVRAQTSSAATGVPCLPTGAESIATTQSYYIPGATVHMTGSGYSPSCDVVVKVTRPDGFVVTGDNSGTPGSDTVTTDLSGGFSYDYVLPSDPAISGTYVVDVIGFMDAVLAHTTFEDAASERLDIAPNYSLTNTAERFSVLIEDTTTDASGNITYAKVTLPAGYSAISVANQTSSAGGPWTTSVSGQVVTAISSTGAGLHGPGTNDWLRLDINATTPSAASANEWAVQTFTQTFTNQTTLNGAIDGTQTSITVTSGAGIANGDVLQIQNEWLKVTAGGGTNTLTVTRGFGGTSAVNHASGTQVQKGANSGTTVSVPSQDLGMQIDATQATTGRLATAAFLGARTTTTSAAVNNLPTTTTLPVTSGAAIVNGDVLLVDSEEMKVTAGGGTNSLTVTRAFGGTTIAGHASGADVRVLAKPTTLSAAITTTNGTSISVNSGAQIKNFDTITIESEKMLVTAGGGTSTLTVARGYGGSAAATHPNGATVYKPSTTSPSVVPSTATTYTMLVTNTDVPNSTDAVDYFTIAVPTCFSGVAVTSSTFTTSEGRTWNASVKDNLVRLVQSANSANINRGIFVAFSFTATAPGSGCTAADSTRWPVGVWHTEPPADNSNQVFPLVAGQPAVTASADLSISKSGPASAIAGDPAGFDYTITVHNNGPFDSTGGFHITDTLPSGVIFQSGAGCSASGQTVTCSTVSGLAAGADKVFTVHATLASTVDSGTDLANSATAASDGTTDPTPGNNTSNTTHTATTEDVHLSATKSFSSAAVTAGGASKTFTVSVSNSGLSDADNLSLTDTVDSRLIVDSVTAGDYTCTDGDSNAQTITCSLAHLGAGATKSITVTYHVASTTDSEAAVSNFAHVASDEDSAFSNTASVQIVEDVQLSVTKTFNSDTVVAGGPTKSFTVDVHNAGVSDADNVSLTDTVDFRLIVDSVNAGSYSCPDGDSNPQTITCLLTHLAPGDTKSITVTYHVASTTDSAAGVSNSATAQSAEASPTSGNDTVDIIEDVHLSVTKSFSSPTVTAGGAQKTFTIGVSNSGVSDADLIFLTDTVDPRLVVDSVSAGSFFCQDVDSNPQTIYCTLAHVAAGDTQSITVTYHVATTTDSDPSVPNAANASSEEDTATGSTSVAIVEDVHLSVTKSFNSATVTAGGGPKTFTVSVSNSGVSDAENLTLTDTVDPRLVVESVNAGSYSCPDGDSNPQTITCSIGFGHLDAGGVRSITVIYHVASTTDSAAGVNNTATAQSDEDGPTSGSNTVDIVEDVHLFVLKSFSSATVTAGGAAKTFTIGVSNSGSSDADNLSLTDTVDSRLVVDSIDPGEYDCSASSGQTIDCSLAHLGGVAKSITVHYHVASTTESDPSVPNTAFASSDEDSANDLATVAIVEDVQLSVEKNFDSATVTAGGTPRSFSISVSNAGASDADNLHVTDIVDPRLIVDSVIAGDYDCSASSGQTIDCSLAHLGSGATKALTVDYHVASTTDSDPSVGNNAHASSDEDTASGSDTVAIVEDVQLSVSKNFADPTVTAGGEPSSFTISVANSGVSDADNLHVNDAVDPRLIVDSIDPGDYDCSASSGQTVDCSLAHLAAAGGKALTVHYHVASTTNSDPNLPNTADAASDEDTATNLTTVAIVEDVKLSATKNFADPTVTAGGAASSFTISVHNAGVSDADNLNVTDTVDPRLIVDSVTAGDYTCTDGDSNPQTVTCSLAHLASGAAKSLTVNFHVASTTESDPSVSNTAHAASDEDTAPNSITSVAIVEDVNLDVTKSFADTSVDAGTGGHTFTISVTNTGASQADNIDLTDAVDSRLIVDSVANGSYSCPDGDSNPQTITCFALHLDSGQTESITATYHVAASTAADPFVPNTANATADDGGIDFDTASVEITTRADVADMKVADSNPVIAGNNLTYTITVTNTGPSDAQAVTLEDILDSALQNPLYCVDSTGSCTPLTPWPASNTIPLSSPMAAGSQQVVTIKATVDPGATQTQISNTATVHSTTSDPNTTNNTASVTVNVTTQADMQITKSDNPDPVTAGTDLTYTMVVTNAGPSVARSVQVTDPVPVGTSFVSADNGGFNNAGTVTWNLGDLPVGSTTLHMVVHVDASTTGTLTNTATVGSTTFDPSGGNNSATATTQVATSADLSITKGDSADPVTAGNNLTYTITVTNGGPSVARSVQITDPVPAGTSFVTADSGGSNIAGTVTWNVGDLAPGSTTVHMTVNVDPHRKTGLSNSATVTSTTTDPTPGDHTATETTAVTPVTTVAITSWTDPVTSGNQNNVSASGTAEAGDTVNLTISDAGNAHTVGPFTMTATGGNWSFSGKDVSSLSDGTITYSVTASDGFGATAQDSKTATKDTVTDVSITSWTDPINAGNKTNVAASGTAEAGDTVNLTISDAGNAHTVGPFTTPATGGNWSFSGMDVSSLNDGTITYSVTATDGFTNTANDSETANKDTVAPTETINQAATQTDPTSAAPIKFTVVFSEAVDPSTFSNADVDLSSSTAGGTLIGNVYDSGNHTTFEVRINGMTTAGDVIAKIKGGGIMDLAGNANVASTSTDNKVTWQPTAGNNTPTVYIDQPAFGSVYAKGSASITLKAHFTDPDNGPWTYTINWDDGTANSTGSLTTSGQSFQANHSFPNTGVYTINVCVKDNVGASGCAQVWIVVYDPNGGFVTGGGFIDVPAGSYTADPTLKGRANFGFNSQYKKNANIPTGETEFNFQLGNMNFHSTAYTWLVVSGWKAQYKGTGTINGAGTYYFTLTAYDGDISGGGGVDKFRIRITGDNNGNAVIFDNNITGPTDMDTALPEAISGGSIVIHKA